MRWPHKWSFGSGPAALSGPISKAPGFAGGYLPERYCEPHEIATLYQFVQKLPVVTTHLQPHEVQLLPWVLEKKGAPFSQPSRSKRIA